MDYNQNKYLEEMMKQDLEYLNPILKEKQKQSIVNLINRFGDKIQFSIVKTQLMDTKYVADDLIIYYQFIRQSNFSSIASPILQDIINRFQFILNNGQDINFFNLKFFMYCIRKYGGEVEYNDENKHYRIQKKIQECLQNTQQEQQQTLQEQLQK